eukprot:9057753-Pyramimonas_sp.AAC.1
MGAIRTPRSLRPSTLVRCVSCWTPFKRAVRARVRACRHSVAGWCAGGRVAATLRGGSTPEKARAPTQSTSPLVAIV